MIEYVEIRGENTNVIGIIDTANTVIWRSVYYGVGDFEIHIAATPETISLLTAGRYVTRTDHDAVGVIERIQITESIEEGETIVASGRFAKSLLDRRIIYNLSGHTNKATILRGNVESEIRAVVKNNAIACPFDSKRNIALLALGESANIPLNIVDINGNTAEKQVSYENLLTYTDGVLEEYEIAAKCVLKNGKFLYTVFSGTDRSVNNTGGNKPVIFSKEFDNLLSSEYIYDESPERNVALIGGAGEGLQRFYSLLAKSESGLQRREIFIDASSISKEYKDENDEDKSYTDTQYNSMLVTKGKQDIATRVKAETFDGAIDVSNGNYIFGRDFFIGDIVTVQNNNIGKYINVRIREALECQDENGYSVEIVYQ